MNDTTQTKEKNITPGVYTSLNELLRIGLAANGFSFLPRQPVHSILSGRHSSRLRGRGMDFDEIKPYRQGDDTRNIDWKSTRRTGKAHVRIYKEERDRKVWLVVSQHSSLFFGSSHQFKSVCAAHAAALALFRVLDSGDRVGAVVHNDHQVSVFKPQKSQSNVMRILEEIVLQNQQLNSQVSSINDDGTNKNLLNEALKPVMSFAKHDDLIVLIGDGNGVDSEVMQKLTRLAMHNDLLAIMVFDPLEQEMPDNGFLLFKNNDQFVDINTSDKQFRKKLKSLFTEKLQRYEQASRMNTIPLIKISTHEPVLDQVLSALGNRRFSSYNQRR